MIREVLKLISKVIITFILTNIQDVVILINFFLEASKPGSLLEVIHVVFGQFLGFSTLLILSLIGYTISFILPVKFFGFLGFLIIYFGLNGLVDLIKDFLKKRKKKKENLQQISQTENIEFIQSELRENIQLKDKQSFCNDIKLIIKVSLVTIANGNDNIAIYVPIFVQSTSTEILAYGLGFLFMVGILCFGCYSFIHFPPIFKFAPKYAQFIIPFVFIGLGIYILIESKCFPWLFKLIKTGKWSIS